MSSLKNSKKEWLKTKSIDYWARAPKMKHAKNIVNQPDTKRANLLFRLNRRQLRIYIMFLTGHGIFKEHLYKMRLSHDKLCRFCKAADESAQHLLTGCRRFDYERCILFGRRKVTLTAYLQSEFKDIMRYLKTTKLLEKFIEFDMRNE